MPARTPRERDHSAPALRDAQPPRPSARLIVARLRTRCASRASKHPGQLVDHHIDDRCDVGKAPRRNATAPELLERHLGSPITSGSFARSRSRVPECRPVTLGFDIGTIKPITSGAAAPPAEATRALPGPREKPTLTRTSSSVPRIAAAERQIIWWRSVTLSAAHKEPPEDHQ